MKAYQERWLKKLKKIDQTKKQILEVCTDIVEDDTGCTDELTMTLASILKTLYGNMEN